MFLFIIHHPSEILTAVEPWQTELAKKDSVCLFHKTKESTILWILSSGSIYNHMMKGDISVDQLVEEAKKLKQEEVFLGNDVHVMVPYEEKIADYKIHTCSKHSPEKICQNIIDERNKPFEDFLEGKKSYEKPVEKPFEWPEEFASVKARREELYNKIHAPSCCPCTEAEKTELEFWRVVCNKHWNNSRLNIQDCLALTIQEYRVRKEYSKITSLKGWPCWYKTKFQILMEQIQTPEKGLLIEMPERKHVY